MQVSGYFDNHATPVPYAVDGSESVSVVFAGDWFESGACDLYVDGELVAKSSGSVQTYAPPVVSDSYKTYSLVLNAHFPDPANPGSYDPAIAAAGGLDLQLFGIGFNGHIAFNEPMKEDEISVEAFGALPTRVLPLSKETIDQNTRLTAGGDEKLMPRFAATMGMAPILAARKCLLLACFEEQQAPLRAIFAKGSPTPFLPASYLWRHPDYRLIYTADKIAL